MKILAILALCLSGCQTLVKDQAQIEQVAEDAAKEAVDDAIKLAPAV